MHIPLLFVMALTSAPPKALDDCTVWTLNEYVNTPETAALAASVPSDMLMRAWFKWEKARDFEADKPFIPVATANGALFGGGVTVSALYRGENGLTPEQWRRLATRDPFGHIIPAWKDAKIAHGAISSEEYLDYVLKWCYAQIDAGVSHLFMDEVEGAYSEFEGFDDAAMRKFADWLVRKYCTGQGWKPDDARWKEKFAIDLKDAAICPGGDIRSFNYREYLIKREIAADPYAEDNPMRGEWGSPGSGEDTFWGWRNDWAWKYLCDHIRDYARARGRTVYITANGLHKYVDYQVNGFWIEWAGDRKHVTTNASYLRKYRGIVLTGQGLAGKPVPVVFFHDWGFDGFPFGELSPADRIRWMRVYAPEVYAAGGIFVWPVNIAGDDLGLMKQYAAWYQAHKTWFHGGTMINSRQLIASDNHVALAFWELPKLNQRLVHVMNHNYNQDIVPVTNLEVRIPSGAKPKTVALASPEGGPDAPAPFTYADNQVTVRIPKIDGYTTISLSYDQLPKDDRLGTGQVAEIQLRPMWGKAPQSRFTVGPDGRINNPDQLYNCLQGRLHPDLRNNPTFVVDYANDGQFIVHVNSIATMGAVLDVLIDGKLALHQDLPDLDHANDAAANEYDQDFTVPVPKGKHEIRIDNPGGDWMSVDYILLVNYAAK